MISPKAYLDAGVLVAYGLGSVDVHYPKAKQVINDVMNRKYRGVVSVLSLLETKDVIRKRLVNRTPRNVLDVKSNLQRKDYIRQESDKRYTTLINSVTKAAKAKKMLVIDFDGINISEVFAMCDNLLSTNFGDIRLFHRCWMCRRRYDHYEYKGIGPVDAMHFDLAKRIRCDVFITTDKSFSGLDGQIAVSIL